MSSTDGKENCRDAVSPASSSRNNVAGGRDCEVLDKPKKNSGGNNNSSWRGDSTSLFNSSSDSCYDAKDNGSSSSSRGFPTSAACSNTTCSSAGNASGVRRRATDDDSSGVCIHQKQQRRVSCENPVASATESKSRTNSSTSKMTSSGNSIGGCGIDKAEHGVASESSSSSCHSGSNSCRTRSSSSSSSDISKKPAVLHDRSSCSDSQSSPPTPAAESHDSRSSVRGTADGYINSSDNNKETETSERSSTTTSRNPTSQSDSKVTGPAGNNSRCSETHEETCEQRGEAAAAAASVVLVAVGPAAAADSTADAAAAAAAGIAAAADSTDLISSDLQQCEDGRGDEDDEEEEEEEEEEVPRVSLTVKWNTKLYDVILTLQDYECFSVADLKERLQQQLSVPADKQKLLGITNATGGRVLDSDLLQALRFKKEKQLLLIGSSDADLLAASAAHAAAMALTDSVLNDFSSTAETVAAGEDDVRTPLHLQRLERVIASTHVQLLHPPREGKKLLVLDLDYTLFDCKSLAASMDELKRPYLDEFLESVFNDYDIAVWSQTHWKWMEMKCTELGLLTNSRYHLCFVLDRSSMFTICSRKKKRKSRHLGSAAAAEELRTHEVKALEIIWRKFPGRWNATNTLHVDDLSRNFAFNPKNGIRVSAYRREKRHKDAELLLLSMYLKMLSKEKDVTAVRHKNWKDRAADLANSNTSYAPSSSSEDCHH